MCSAADGGNDEGEPKDGREDNRSNAAAVEGAMVTIVTPRNITPERGNGDEGRKPEDHGQELDGSNGELVSRTWEARWRKDEVCYGEQRPYRGKEHEVEAVG